ncbi:MAG: hypothetical protein ABL888_02250 [Pirellulaceae bacterium]
MVTIFQRRSRLIQPARLLTAFCLVVALTTVGQGDVIWLVNGEIRYAIVLAESGEFITVADRLESANQKTTEIPRSEVNALLRTIDLKKLGMLDPNSANTFRELVEDLSRFPHDPLACDLARRLRLIGLTLADRTLRMDFYQALHDSLDEGDRNRLAEIVEVWRHDDQMPSQEKFTATKTDVDRLRTLVQAMWRESWESVGELMEDSRVRRCQENWAQVITWQEIEIAFQTRQVSRVVLAKLLRLDRELANVLTPLEIVPADLNWQASGAAEFRGSAVLPTVKNQFGIDPQLSVFRNGAWVKP